MDDNKKKKYILIGILAIVVIAIAVIVLVNSGHRVIKVSSFDGKVILERNSDEKDIIDGMNLKSKDAVITGADGLVELLVDDDKHILAKENTRFKITSKGNENKGKLKIKLEYGTALVEIDRKLGDDSSVELETPNASISVRGTTFETTYSDGEDTSVVKVSDGVVKVKTDKDSKRVESGNMATITKDGEIYIEPYFAYNDVSAFEAEHWINDGPTGIFVKELVGWNYVVHTGDDYNMNEFKKDNVIIRYSVSDVDEIVSNMNMTQSEGHESYVEYIENGDGDTIACVYYYPNSENIRTYSAYKYIKKVEDNTYIVINIFNYDGIDSSGNVHFETFLPLTMNCYYIYEDDINLNSEDFIDIFTGNVLNSDTPEAIYEDITSFAHSEEVTFYLNKWGTDEAAGVGVKQLVEWEHFANGDKNDFRKGRVNITYSAYSSEKYTSLINMSESEGYVLEYLQNDDGDTIICHATEKVIEDFERRDYKYYKQVSEDVYIGLLVNYENYIDSIVDTNLSTFLPLTNDEYYAIEENATPNVGEGTTVSEEELPNLIKGEVNRGQLEYLLDVAETCRFDGNEDYIYTGLDILWYMYYRDVVVPKDGSSFTYYTYDLEYLNNLYSALTDDVIGDNNIPSVAAINGNELVYDPCTITMGGGVSTTINKVTQYENNQLIVEYNFIKTTGSDGMIGVKGISKAYFTKDSDGKYVFDHIEEVSSEDFNYN